MKRVLLVEDDASDVELVTAAMERHAATIQLEHAASGDAAWRLLRERALQGGDKLPACILLDMVLGAHDGIWLLARMKPLARVRDIPVIVLSQRADAVTRARDFPNVVGAMEKPADDHERRRLVNAVLRLAGGMGVSV